MVETVVLRVAGCWWADVPMGLCSCSGIYWVGHLVVLLEMGWELYFPMVHLKEVQSVKCLYLGICSVRCLEFCKVLE